MKIGVDIRVLMDKNYSGVSRYLDELLGALFKIEKEKRDNKREESQDDYLLFYNSYKKQDKLHKSWENDFSQIKFLSWPNKVFNYIFQKIFSYPKLDLFLNKPDIFWQAHFNFSSFSKNSNTKKVITVHDISFLRYPEFFSYRKNFWHRALGIKKLLEEASGIVAVSENTKYDLVDILGIDEDKIRVIYSGYLPPKESLANSLSEELKQEFFKKHKLEAYSQSGFILYLGTIEPRKNLVNLIKAYELWRLSLQEGAEVLPLVLAGAVGWKTRAIFAAKNNSIYKDDIFFLSYVNDRERELLYKQAKVFVYPSFYEGFGLPPLEAMSRSVPVITANVSSLPEVVADAALMIDPNKATEIAKALSLVLSDENFRQELIKRGQARVKFFSWEKTAREYLQFFSDLNRKPKVLVAMSGGVDSSVAACLLKEQGYEVHGVFLKFWQDEFAGEKIENKASSSESLQDAQAVAEKLEIPFFTLDYSCRFKEAVVDEFLNEYAAGKTPNPCVSCNREIKIGGLLREARALGFDYLATGHYLKIKQEGNKWQLFKAKDNKKDQSYFLYTLKREELKKLLFPLANLDKLEVRALAEKHNLKTAKKPESQDICFLSGDHNNFLKKHLELKEGEIRVQGSEELIGKHQGLPLYTIGQRRGLVGGIGPFYVAGFNYEKNILYVVKEWNDNILYRPSFILSKVNWLNMDKPEKAFKAEVVIRYGHKAVDCLLSKIEAKNLNDDSNQELEYLVTFTKAQRAVTPGQSAVFYKKDLVLGGGIIK